MLKTATVDLAVRQCYRNVFSGSEERIGRRRRCGFQVVGECDEPSSGSVPVYREKSHVELSLGYRFCALDINTLACSTEDAMLT
jgi:hypothetical protein